MSSKYTHHCQYTTTIKGSFRDKQVIEGETILGSGITVWEHKCSTCGSTLYSVSQWQLPPSSGGIAKDAFGMGATLRTPPPKDPSRKYSWEESSPPKKKKSRSRKNAVSVKKEGRFEKLS